LVLQSWSRCVGARRDPLEAVSFEPVTRSRLNAALERSRGLLQAAEEPLAQLEQAIAGTGCRVLLTDARGVIVHATRSPARSGEAVLRSAARPGVCVAEAQVGTNAPAIVLHTRQPALVMGGEHFFAAVASLRCAAAPVRDGRGQLAGVLDLSAERGPFAFDAGALVGVYATLIENRLLLARSRDHLVLRFQVCPTMLDGSMQALVGVDSRGRVAWINGTGQRLLGLREGEGASAEVLFGLTAEQLLALGDRRPVQLPNGLQVWVAAQAPFVGAAAPVDPEVAPLPEAEPAAPTLKGVTQAAIQATLAACHGNVSQAARRLGVSRGLLYRRLRSPAAG
jgi:transcriptional regulator of acetoin/glycerol metabolism